MTENTPNSTAATRVCPRCGTKVSEDASRCVVCGAQLRPGAGGAMRSARGAEVTLTLPLAISLLVVFALLSAGATFLGMRFSGLGAPPPVDTTTPTETSTATVTPTSQPTDTPSPQPSPTPLTHVVGESDTCVAIAGLYNISIQALIQANQLPVTCPLSVGQKLSIPQPTATATSAPSPTPLPEEATRQACPTVDYTVQANDTLFGIATNYNVDMTAIQDWNGLTGDTVFEGQKLSIPLCHRLTPSGPTATPTLPPPYPAPNLLLPQDGAAYTLADDSVTLQWASVGTLRDNEYYQVHIVDITEGSGNRQLVAEVQDTKYIVPTSFRPNEALPHIMRWWVETVRQTGSNDAGDPIYDSAGDASAKRDFSWSGAATGAATPTP